MFLLPSVGLEGVFDMLRWITWGLAILLVAAAILFGEIWSNRFAIPAVPIPDSAEGVSVATSILFPYKTIGFTVSKPCLDKSIFEFYESWARQEGWDAVIEPEERWGPREWQSFMQASRSTQKAQFLAHWATQDRRWSLVLVLECERESREVPWPATQSAGLAIERYMPVGVSFWESLKIYYGFS